MNIDVKKILPKDPSTYKGLKSIRIITALYLLIVVIRSCIHIFASDGGANSIAGIDVSVEGGDNIIAIFHQWGAIQLILAGLLVAIDPIMRALAGQMMSVTSQSTPPGEALNWPAFFTLVLLFAASIVESSSTKEK